MARQVFPLRFTPRRRSPFWTRSLAMWKGGSALPSTSTFSVESALPFSSLSITASHCARVAGGKASKRGSFAIGAKIAFRGQLHVTDRANGVGTGGVCRVQAGDFRHCPGDVRSGPLHVARNAPEHQKKQNHQMKIQQIYTGCIAHAAYYLESNGEAAIFDPLREVQPYIDRANADGAKIKYVFETHFHADFVSGHLDLAAKTGATIVYGPTAKPGFEAHVATDGEVFNVGKAKVKVIHTPGPHHGEHHLPGDR